jgi:hypothetical protein
MTQHPHATHRIGDDSGPGCPFDAPVENKNKKCIQYNVGDGADKHDQHGFSGYVSVKIICSSFYDRRRID